MCIRDRVGADGQMLIDILGEYGVDTSLVAMTQGHTCLLYTSDSMKAAVNFN